jgi:hypothetical protein
MTQSIIIATAIFAVFYFLVIYLEEEAASFSEPWRNKKRSTQL